MLETNKQHKEMCFDKCHGTECLYEVIALHTHLHWFKHIICKNNVPTVHKGVRCRILEVTNVSLSFGVHAICSSQWEHPSA